MLKNAEKQDLNQISITGTRAILLLGLLLEYPRTLEEIRNIFIKIKLLDENSSNDILRIDLNTLKLVGCKIPRATKTTGYKYFLEKHPFTLTIQDEEITILKNLYKSLKNTADIADLIAFDNLIKTISTRIYDKQVKEDLLGISLLKHFDAKLLEELLLDCKNKRTILFEYNSRTENEIHEEEVVAEKIVLNNDKLYLYGYDLKKKRSSMFNIKYIKALFAKKMHKEDIKPDNFIVKFRLKDFGINNISENEKILMSDENGYLIEGIYYNEFIAMQRILSFGANCTIIEPCEFKENIISILRKMKMLYER